MELHEPREKRRGEDLFGWIVLIVGVVLFWQSYEIAGFSALSSPGAFPLAASSAMVIAAVVVVINNSRHPRAAQGEPILPVTVAAFSGLVLAYAVLLGPLGFLPASFLFLISGMKLLHGGGWGRVIALALVSVVAIYVVFRLVFQVVLPEGVMPEREIMAWIEGLFAGGVE